MEQTGELAHRCLLLENRELAEGWHLFELQAEGLVHADPGQFVQLRIGSATDPLLRRPLSIHYADAQRGRLRLLFQIAGSGTALAAQFRAGEELDLLGPFGRGFPHLDEKALAIFVSGGIGMAPLFFAAAVRRGAGLPFKFLLGGKADAQLPPDEYFRSHGIEAQIVTDDGSRGDRGSVTLLLERSLENLSPPYRIHACGPMAMLSRVVELARPAGAAVHLSLESRMACGIGACLGCVHPFYRGEQIEYRRVCLEGPVFDGEEVVFEK